MEGEFLQRKKPKLDERFLIRIQGGEFVLYSGLLNLAHQKGLMKLEVLPLQLPSKENNNTAIVRATAVNKYGETFSDVGDANPMNCNKAIANHVLRMASTRAKARALRDMSNIGMTCLEELGDLDDVIPRHSNQKTAMVKKVSVEPKQIEQKQEMKVPDNGNSQPEVKPATVQKPEASLEPSKEKRMDKPKDAKQSKQSSASQKGSGTLQISEAQRNAAINLARRRGLSEDDLETFTNTEFNSKLEDLTAQEASLLIRKLQSAA